MPGLGPTYNEEEITLVLGRFNWGGSKKEMAYGREHVLWRLHYILLLPFDRKSQRYM